MKAVKGIYENGRIQLSEQPSHEGPLEVLVVFAEPAGDPWATILNEATPRESFLQFAAQCEVEIRQGKDAPLNLDDL